MTMMTAKVTRRTLSISEVAEMFGVSAKAIRRWVRADTGFPAPLCYGHAWMWSAEVIEKALAGEYTPTGKSK
jgi:predicted DNA-binding transcriptional regulator AlpA